MWWTGLSFPALRTHPWLTMFPKLPSPVLELFLEARHRVWALAVGLLVPRERPLLIKVLAPKVPSTDGFASPYQGGKMILIHLLGTLQALGLRVKRRRSTRVAVSSDAVVVFRPCMALFAICGLIYLVFICGPSWT